MESTSPNSNSQAENNNAINAQVIKVQELKTAIQHAEETIGLSARCEPVAVVLGSTKCGKSTLINYIIGNPLLTEKKRFSKVYMVKQEQNDWNGPEIGIGSVSQTKGPSRWESNRNPGLVLWDCPGFGDNRGEIQDITNAYCIKQLLHTVESAKIVLLVNVDSLIGSVINPFLSLLASLEAILLDNFRDCFESIALIFTQVPPLIFDQEVTKSLFAELLRERLLEQTELQISDNCKKYIEFLCSHIDDVGYFKHAEKPDIVVDETFDVDIIDAIEKARPISNNILKTISPSLSYQSQNYLHQAKSQLYDMKKFDELFVIFEQRYTENIKNVEKMIIVHEKQSNNELFQNIVKIEKEIEMFCVDPAKNTCGNILLNIELNSPVIVKDFLRQNKLVEKSKLVEFIDACLGYRDDEIIITKLKRTTSNLMTKIQVAKININTALDKISQEDAQRLIEVEKAKHAEVTEGLQKKIGQLEEENKYYTGFFSNVGAKLDSCILQ